MKKPPSQVKIQPKAANTIRDPSTSDITCPPSTTSLPWPFSTTGSGGLPCRAAPDPSIAALWVDCPTSSPLRSSPLSRCRKSWGWEHAYLLITGLAGDRTGFLDLFPHLADEQS